MRKQFLMIFWLVIIVSSGVLAQSQTQITDTLEGLDPVLLIQGKETQGDLKISVTRGSFRYLFASEATKAEFEKDPTQYEIQLNGACARMGAPVLGLPDLWAVHQGHIYIFGSEQCKKLFVSAPEKYLPPARLSNVATPEALNKGAAILTRAVAAMGGTDKIDRLISYHEKSVSTQTRGQQGEVEIRNDLLMVFPDRARLEVTMPDFNDASVMMRMTTVLGSELFVISRSGKVLPLNTTQQVNLEQQLQIKPLFILRKHDKLQAAYIGVSKAGDTTVEQVVIELAGVPATLGIEPTTGRLLSLSFQRRGPAGTYGDFRQSFADFRTVNGITLPFRIIATFDGQPWKDQSSAIESISINEAIDLKRFEKPQEK